MVAVAVLSVVLGGCGTSAVGAGRAKADGEFLDSVYSQATDIRAYRTGAQLVSLGQAVCADLSSGASVQEIGDRVLEGGETLSPADLGAVISAAVNVLCPKFRGALNG